MVSIIVPVYNAENSLRYCIDSILNQTYADFELILINDGSSDNSGMICDQYALLDSRIKVIHKENGGVSSARNAGIEASKGEYICFVDSDDFIESTYTEELMKIKLENPDCDNIWCGFQLVNGYEKFDILRKVVFSKSNIIEVLSTKEVMTIHDKWLDYCPVCKLFRKDIVLKHNIRFPLDLSLGEDAIFNYSYLDCTNKKIVIINLPLYNYVRTAKETLTNMYHQNLFEKYRLINKTIYDFLKKWNCDEKQFSIYYNNCFFAYEFVLKNTFRPNSTIKHKYIYNNKILKSYEFKNALNNSTCYIHPLYRVGYLMKSYQLIRLLEKVILLKQKLL